MVFPLCTCRRLSTPLGLALGIATSHCRPPNYAPPPPEPELAPAQIPLGDIEGYDATEVEHAALYGADSAPASALTPPADAVISPDGLISTVLRAGSGTATPQPGETVIFHMTGWTAAGDRFESTHTRRQPERADPRTLVPGLREGLEVMVTGEKRRLWIPARLGYGPSDPGGKPMGDLIVDLELLKILEAPKIPDVPEDLLAPPAEAHVTPQGVRFVVLEAGQGSRRPTQDDRVEVHYTGWSRDGNRFDSSVARGAPAQFGVSEVIAGWTDMLMQMVEGQRVRVWIPSKLAYGDDPGGGRPAGDLVFDIELLRIL